VGLKCGARQRHFNGNGIVNSNGNGNWIRI
jgi:hypothetical protein